MSEKIGVKLRKRILELLADHCQTVEVNGIRYSKYHRGESDCTVTARLRDEGWNIKSDRVVLRVRQRFYGKAAKLIGYEYGDKTREKITAIRNAVADLESRIIALEAMHSSQPKDKAA